ncbi:DUF5640 domain-containing protein [Lentzea sp. NPDC055074]
MRGSRITFTGTDGKSATEDWSISGGTLTLAGSWMGLDDIFETLTFDENGTYRSERDGGATASGTFKVQGDQLTTHPSGGSATKATFSVADATLTLRTSAGTVQYVRSS